MWHYISRKYSVQTTFSVEMWKPLKNILASIKKIETMHSHSNHYVYFVIKVGMQNYFAKKSYKNVKFHVHVHIKFVVFV